MISLPGSALGPPRAFLTADEDLAQREPIETRGSRALAPRIAVRQARSRF